MATVFVDGYKCGRRIVRKSIGYMDGIYTSETTARPFIFSSPNFTGKNDHFHPLYPASMHPWKKKRVL